MKVLIYDNKEKDVNGECKAKLIESLEKNNLNYQILNDSMLSDSMSADALFVIGGDGTILYIVEFALNNNIPIIGINMGKLGFLCEFEKSCIDDAVLEFKNSKLIKDERSVLSINYKGKDYFALNELYIQKFYDPSVGNGLAGLQIEIDGEIVSKFSGDGVMICTPTGSTAYSFSYGAPILVPHADVFTMIPIASHSFNQRPVIYSSDSKCKISSLKDVKVGVFIDGKLVDYINKGDDLQIAGYRKKLLFLRNKDYSFFKKLSNKLYKALGEEI